MTFEIILAPEAIRDLEKLRANIRAEVRDAIERHLRNRPTKTPKARIKRLRGVSRAAVPVARARCAGFLRCGGYRGSHPCDRIKGTGRGLVATGGE